jgi:hypothetical protein
MDAAREVTLRTALVLSTALFVMTLGAGSASARCQHFCKGGIDLGLGFGGESRDGDLSLVFSGHAGYFVMDGLVMGLEALYQTDPEYVLPELYARYHFVTTGQISPFVTAKAGHVFWLDSDWDDVTLVSGGGGLSYFLTQNLAAMVFVIYQHPLHDDYEGSWDFGGGLGAPHTVRRRGARSRHSLPKKLGQEFRSLHAAIAPVVPVSSDARSAGLDR